MSARTPARRRSPRSNVKGDPRNIELLWVSKRGAKQVNQPALNAPGVRRFYIEIVRAAPGGSYWSTEEVAGDEQYAFHRATSLALTEGRSVRVSRRRKWGEEQ